MAILVATFTTVVAAEIGGDKLIYTAALLTARSRAAPVMLGIVIASAAKMGIAVVVGEAVGKLPRELLVGMTVAGFSCAAWQTWRQPLFDADPSAHSTSKSAVASFTTILLSEWADPGQMAAAALAADLRRPALVWAGAVLAMLTKAVVGVLVSIRIMRRIAPRIQPTAIRYTRVTLIVLVAVWSLVELSRIPPPAGR